MTIELHKVTVRELVEGYVDDAETGVRGYGGRLDIRPPYQREFVYKEKERNAVISTVMRGFPLNVMYWVKKADGTFEVMDGQQRTISLCQYAAGDFAWGELDLGAKYFHRQLPDVQRKFLDYELMVYFCAGPPSEKSVPPVTVTPVDALSCASLQRMRLTVPVTVTRWSEIVRLVPVTTYQPAFHAVVSALTSV